MFFVDTSGWVKNPAQSQALVAAGYTLLMRCIGGTQPLTPAEIQSNATNGVTVIGAYQMYPSAYNTTTGAACGNEAVPQAIAAGMNMEDHVLACDLEGNYGEDYYGWLDTWLSIVYPQWKPTNIWIYPGVNCNITTAQWQALSTKYPGIVVWTPYPNNPPQGITVIAAQIQDNVVIGSGAGAQAYDIDTLYQTWTDSPGAHPDHDVPTPTAGSNDTFVFELEDDEDVGARFVRCWEEFLSEGPTGHALQPNRYKSFINACNPAGYIGGQAVQDISAWSTSCLITQQLAKKHCEAPVPSPVNGAGFYQDLGVPNADNFVKFVPGSAMVPDPGDICYWANTGTDGHVEAFRRLDADGKTWLTAGGGGGTDGTECSLRTHLNGVDAYGRALQGWWKIEQQGLPPSPVTPPAPVTPPTPPAAPTIAGRSAIAATGITAASLATWWGAHWTIVVAIAVLMIVIFVLYEVWRKPR